MKILMIGGSPFTTFMSLGVSLLSSLAKQRDCEFELFDLCRYNFDVVDEHSLGESLMEFKKITNPERAPKTNKRSKDVILDDFMGLVESFQPDLIGLSATSVDACFGKGLLEKVKSEIDIPVIVGGVYPTVDPESVIAESWVDMINVGQGEESFVELIDSYQQNKRFDTSIQNIWFKRNGKIIRNSMRPALKDLDWLPYPDWSIFDEHHFYRPFTGYLYKHGGVEISRGCPLSCKFCINSYLPKIYGANRYSTKSVERAIDEIEFLRDKYQLEFLRFLDEIFLQKKLDYLELFAEIYQKRIGLPFIISTTATSVTPEKVKLLKEMNCVNVGLGVETGSEELRAKVLNKKVPNKDYKRAYQLLNDAGIRATAQLMFGIPHESVEDYKTTIRMIKEWEVDTAHVAVFYPFKGTALRESAIEDGLLDKEKIEEFERDRFISTRNTGTMLKFSKEQIEQMEHYRKFFVLYKELPEWLWPLVEECAIHDHEFSQRLESLLRDLVAKKRFS